MAIEIKQEHLLYAGAAAVGIAVVAAASRGGGGRTVAVTGPSEATTRELVRASVDLADIYTSAETERFRIESETYISDRLISSGERVRIQEIEGSQKLARILIEPNLIQARAAAAEGERNFFGDLLKTIFGVFGF